MYCPKCRAEYVDGITECTDCQEQLVNFLSDEPQIEDVKVEWETILSTGDHTEVEMAKSFLSSAGIDFLVKNEGSQDLFGLGRLGTDYNPVTGPIKVLVPKEDAEEARAILRSAPEEKFEASEEEGREEPAVGASKSRMLGIGLLALGIPGTALFAMVLIKLLLDKPWKQFNGSFELSYALLSLLFYASVPLILLYGGIRQLRKRD